MPATTTKGAATRERIVAAAADLVLARGVGNTSLDDIRAGTATSKSQLFHYFPGGKRQLVGALAAHEYARVLDAQRPHIDDLGSWASWEGWRAAVLAHYAEQPWGCPIGALVSEVMASDPELAAEIQGHMDDWRARLTAGVARLTGSTDAERLGLGVFAALQGGLLLMQSLRSLEPLEAALDAGLASLRAQT